MNFPNLSQIYSSITSNPTYTLALYGAIPPLITTVTNLFLKREPEKNLKESGETALLTASTFTTDLYFADSIGHGGFVSPLPFIEDFPTYLAGSLVGVLPALAISALSFFKRKRRNEYKPRLNDSSYIPRYDIDKGMGSVVPYLGSQTVPAALLYRGVTSGTAWDAVVPYFGTFARYMHFVSSAVATIPRFLYGLFKRDEDIKETAKKSFIFGAKVGAISEIIDFHREGVTMYQVNKSIKDIGANCLGALFAAGLGSLGAYLGSKIKRLFRRNNNYETVYAT